MISRKIRDKRKRYKKRKQSYKKRVQRGGQSNVYHFYNKFHYGDSILNLKFFYNISDILKANNIQIRYYYDGGYIKNPNELERYVNKDVVTLDLLANMPANTIELWMGNDIIGNQYPSGKFHHGNVFNTYFNSYYKNILSILKLEDKKIDTSLFQNEPYLQDIYNKLDSKYHNIDILINNTQTASGQYVYDKQKMDTMCIRLANKYNVVVLDAVEGSDIKSTRKDGLSLQDIGAISTHAKYIISPNSGPLIPCFNLDTKNSVKKWIMIGGPNKFKEISPIVIPSIDDLDSIDQYLV